MLLNVLDIKFIRQANHFDWFGKIDPRQATAGLIPTHPPSLFQELARNDDAIHHTLALTCLPCRFLPSD